MSKTIITVPYSMFHYSAKTKEFSGLASDLGISAQQFPKDSIIIQGKNRSVKFVLRYVDQSQDADVAIYKGVDYQSHAHGPSPSTTTEFKLKVFND
jgi:hypothetical protein